jgi:UTP--glucose-1-phosphate uridylyltransferase
MQAMIDDGHDYFACDIQNSTYYDAGNKLQYIKTVIDFALRRDDIGDDVRRYLEERISK